MSSFTTLKKMTTESRGMRDEEVGELLVIGNADVFWAVCELESLGNVFFDHQRQDESAEYDLDDKPTRPPTRPAAGPSPTTCMDSTFTSCAVPGPVSAKA